LIRRKNTIAQRRYYKEQFQLIPPPTLELPNAPEQLDLNTKGLASVLPHVLAQLTYCEQLSLSMTCKNFHNQTIKFWPHEPLTIGISLVGSVFSVNIDENLICPLANALFSMNLKKASYSKKLFVSCPQNKLLETTHAIALEIEPQIKACARKKQFILEKKQQSRFW
jgi:hypothetical protein